MENSVTSSRLAEFPRPVFERVPAALDKSLTKKARQSIALMKLGGKPLDFWQQQSMAIMVGEAEPGLWACSDYFEWVARQNGKGALLEARALGGFLCWGEPIIGWSAHEYKTVMESRSRVVSLLRRIGATDYKDRNLLHITLPGQDTFRVKLANSHGEEEIIRLDTEQRIKFFARSKGAARGFSAGTWLLDETFALSEEEVDAISPTQLTFNNAQTIYASTPPLTGETGRPMYLLRQRAEEGDPELGGRDWGLRWTRELLRLEEGQDHPMLGQVIYLDEIDGRSGAEGWPPVDVDSLPLWWQTNPAGRPSPGKVARIGERARRKDRRVRGRIGYAREALCIWPRPVVDESDTIDTELWATRGDPESAPDGRLLVLSVDVSPGAKSAAVASCGRRADGRLHVKVMQYRPGTSWVLEYLKEAAKRLRPRAIMINSSGPAGAIREELIAGGIRKLEDVNGTEWGRACAAFLNDVQEDSLRHCDQATLDSAISCATRKYFGDGAWYWFRKDSSGDICPLAAVTAAAHGFRIHGRRRLGSPPPSAPGGGTEDASDAA